MKRYLLGLVAISGFCLVFFFLSQNHLASPWMKLALDEEINDLLVQSIQHQRKLATLDPENEAVYKAHFKKTQALLAHLEVLQANRHKLTTRYNLVLVLLFVFFLALSGVYQLYHRRIMDMRLSGLQKNLERLAVGDANLEAPSGRTDVLGRIDAMIHQTAGAMFRHRQRLKYLENLESWQESSRRIAHEIRTPLTTIRLEVRKLIKAVYKKLESDPSFLNDHEQSIQEELDQLTRFTDQYTSFAKIGKPKLKDTNLNDYLLEYAELYAQAWPDVELKVASGGAPMVSMDRRLIRQVLVNLCNNSAKALDGKPGVIGFSIREEGEKVLLQVKDNGPGVDDSLRKRLFDPYITSGPGEGLGLGLAISKKILLDHNGDLDLEEDSGPGAAFTLGFPKGGDVP